MAEEKASSAGGHSGGTSVGLQASVPEEKASSAGEKAAGDAGETSVDLQASMAEEKASLAGEKAGSDAGQASTPPSADRGGGGIDAPPPAASAGGRSFSQLLAGAMTSPAGSTRPQPIVTVPVVAVPCFLTPTTLIESQGFAGQFAMTHQAVLATVTAQAQMQLQAASSSNSITNSFPQPMLSTVNPMPLQQMPQPTPEKTSGDAYNWRKYGQKQVKSSENARSYYRCTDSNCSAKKKVERCPDGMVVEVIYKGKHNHDPPHKHRYTRDRGAQSGGPPLENENESSEHPKTETNESDPSACKTEQKSSNETPKQQLYCSSDCVLDAGTKSEEDIVDEPDPKRRLSENSKSSSAPILKTIREYIVQTEIDARHLSDGYRWRKYGQKIVKGNNNPRSYYRCTHNGCPVRKHVERVTHDAKALLITYEGEHNHDQPTLKYASDPPSTTTKSNVAAGVADEEPSTSNSLSVEKSSEESRQNNVVEKVAGDRELELGGDRALESAQALLSIGFSSSSGEGTGRNNPEGIKSPVFNENPAAVPVQNT